MGCLPKRFFPWMLVLLVGLGCGGGVWLSGAKAPEAVAQIDAETAAVETSDPAPAAPLPGSGDTVKARLQPGAEWNLVEVRSASAGRCPTPETGQSSGGNDAELVVAEGQAAIVVDPSSARDRAILDAKIKAAERLGVLVSSESLVSMGSLLDQVAEAQAFALVKAYEVLDEWRQNGIYFVCIKAWVKKGPARAEARREILQDRILLMLTDGGDSAAQIEKKLKDKLVKAGFAVLDRKIVQNRVSAPTWQCLQRGRTDCVGEDFYPFLANYLITIESTIEPSQELGAGVKSFYAEAQIDSTQISSGQLSVSAEKSDIVFGLNRRQAVRGRRADQFPLKIAAPLSAEFMERLARRFETRRRDVQVTVRGLPDPDAFQRFRNLVRELRWVKGLSGEEFAGGTGRIRAAYEERSLYLAAMIDFRGEYTVDRYTWDTIDITFQR